MNKSLPQDLVIFFTPFLHSVCQDSDLTLLHSERPKVHTILAFLSAVGLKWLDTL